MRWSVPAVLSSLAVAASAPGSPVLSNKAVCYFLCRADMGRGCSDRQVSKKYVSYLHEWDRRLKKTVVAPHMEAAPHRE